MRNTISRKILLAVFVPFIIIFVALSAYIVYTIFIYVNDWTELELKGISEINAADLQGRMRSVEISVNSAADVLEVIDPKAKNARVQAEEIVKSMFNNGYIYNAWLAYEPNAFDGKDSENIGDYPGSITGRFIRSYILEDGEIIVAPDMDEDTLDDPEASPWYVIPRDTGLPYIDVDNTIPNLYDYGVGADPVYTLSIVAPLYNGRRVVGCVGADLLFDNMTFGIDGSMQAAVAVFYPNGRIFYAQDLKFSEESIGTLGFNDPVRIFESVSSGKSLFLPNEYSPFLDAPAFTYFQPVGEEDEFGNLSLYVALPRAVASETLRPIMILGAVIVAAVLAAIAAMYLYVARQIGLPLGKLTLAADAISRGNLESEIPAFTKSMDEIGLLSRALYRMVEQFRVDISNLRQTQEQLRVHALIYMHLKDSGAGSIPETFDALSALLCEHFGIYRTSFALYDAHGPAVVGCMVSDSGNAEPFSQEDFLYSTQADAIMSGKKIAFMNKHVLSVGKLSFLHEETVSLCMAALSGKHRNYGYLVFENKNKNKHFGASDESVLLYITNVIGDWLDMVSGGFEPPQPETQQTETLPLPLPDIRQTETPPEAQDAEPSPATEETAADIISAASRLDGIDTEAAITAMGGLRGVYEGSLRLTVRLIPESAAKLDDYIENDIEAFAIDIHGIKGAMNTVGADELGKAALEMELAAKAGDIETCKEKYPPFREKLMQLYEALGQYAAEEKTGTRQEGDKNVLAAALASAQAAAEDYDSLTAAELIAPLAELAYGEKEDALLEKISAELEQFDCENALADIIELRNMCAEGRAEE